jgi:hypothetical protein
MHLADKVAKFAVVIVWLGLLDVNSFGRVFLLHWWVHVATVVAVTVAIRWRAVVAVAPAAIMIVVSVIIMSGTAVLPVIPILVFIPVFVAIVVAGILVAAPLLIVAMLVAMSAVMLGVAVVIKVTLFSVVLVTTTVGVRVPKVVVVTKAALLVAVESDIWEVGLCCLEDVLDVISLVRRVVRVLSKQSVS